MPTPIAHSSVWLLARIAPTAKRALANARPPQRRLFALASIGLLCWPDSDFLLRRLGDYPPLGHGGLTHSLAAGVAAALVYAVICRWILQFHIGWRPLFLFGLPLAWSHPLMDMVTYRGSVMLFWPLSESKISGPPLFYGARHSELAEWPLHLITLSTELAFVGVIWLVSRRINGRNRKALAPRRS